MRFVDFSEVQSRLSGRSIAIVGSAPSVLDNPGSLIDSHEIVIRVNNYKTGLAQGKRCDVHYSFYGNSIRKKSEELQRDGVKLCLCKCPNSKPLECAWHEAKGKQLGIDFRYIYGLRNGWWFCDTFIPSDALFMEKFLLMDRHIPTTGFSCILDVLACAPRKVYITGFDFFASGIHNIDEKWRPGDPEDPIGHRPDLEMAWLVANFAKHPIQLDVELEKLAKGAILA